MLELIDTQEYKESVSKGVDYLAFEGRVSTKVKNFAKKLNKRGSKVKFKYEFYDKDKTDNVPLHVVRRTTPWQWNDNTYKKHIDEYIECLKSGDMDATQDMDIPLEVIIDNIYFTFLDNFIDRDKLNQWIKTAQLQYES